MKFRSPNLYTIIIVTKIKKCFLNKKERVKGFSVFMTMPSFKQVESNYGKKEPWERACSTFSHCLNFENWKCGIITFSIRTQNGCTCYKHKEKILQSEQLLILFKS